MNFSQTLRKSLLAEHLQLINCWDHFPFKMTATAHQLETAQKCLYLSKTVTETKSGAVVADSHSQHVPSASRSRTISAEDHVICKQKSYNDVISQPEMIFV